MLDEAAADQIIARLDHVIVGGQLSPATQTQARALRDRLNDGVRVVILGPEGIGKSQLRDVLLGEIVTSAAGTGGALCLSDINSTAEITGPDGAAVQTATLDNALLKLMTLTDVAMPEGAAAFADRAAWALARADIVLWCTQSFTAAEAAVWAEASDHLKDHSFLVLTKADALAASGSLSDRIAALQAVAAEEFHSFFPTSTFHAHQALHQAGSANDSQLAASGVKALRDTLWHLAVSGQRADLDSALLFLERHAPSAPLPQAPSKDRSGSGPQAQTFEKALSLLRSRTADLAGEDPQMILTTCGRLAEDLAELAADQTHSEPAFDLWRHDLYEASDKVVLMSLENDLRSAADAATVILQLKRDLEYRVAS